MSVPDRGQVALKRLKGTARVTNTDIATPSILVRTHSNIHSTIISRTTWTLLLPLRLASRAGNARTAYKTKKEERTKAS
jgi:hypothetical protein